MTFGRPLAAHAAISCLPSQVDYRQLNLAAPSAWETPHSLGHGSFRERSCRSFLSP